MNFDTNLFKNGREFRKLWSIEYFNIGGMGAAILNTGDSLYLKVQGTRKKYFELSVVWDSQFVTSFTLYMLDHRDYNLHVHVFGNDKLQFKYPLTELLISDINFGKAVTEIRDCWWLLTSKNPVKQCSTPKVTKATLCSLWG